MKYFIDTHDKTKGSFPKEELTEQQFFLPLRDGLPKFKDVPAEIGGSGERTAE